MNLNIKAGLLSALVLPGLGQIVNGKKLKGFILITLVNMFILTALVVILKGMGPFLVAMQAGGPVDAVAVMDQVQKSGGSGPRWLLNGFIVIWLYAFVDALVDRPKEESEVLKTE